MNLGSVDYINEELYKDFETQSTESFEYLAFKDEETEIYAIPAMFQPKLRLVKVNVIHVYQYGTIVRRTLKETPDSIVPIIRYAQTLKEKYGKRVSLCFVKTRDKLYLRFKREDGIPIYIDVNTRETYVREADKNLAVVNIAIGFLWSSCGYKFKTKTVVPTR